MRQYWEPLDASDWQHDLTTAKEEEEKDNLFRLMNLNDHQ
jgi:hypothetical protein